MRWEKINPSNIIYMKNVDVDLNNNIDFARLSPTAKKKLNVFHQTIC